MFKRHDVAGDGAINLYTQRYGVGAKVYGIQHQYRSISIAKVEHLTTLLQVPEIRTLWLSQSSHAALLPAEHLRCNMYLAFSLHGHSKVLHEGQAVNMSHVVPFLLLSPKS